MKRICTLILALCLFAPVLVFADDSGDGNEEKKGLWWFETEVKTSGVHNQKIWYERDLTKRIGFYGFVFGETTGYKNGYAGLYVKPHETVQIGIGAGREEDASCASIRKNVYFAIDTERFHSFGTLENGCTGPWHRVHAVYKFDAEKKWATGPMYDRNDGLGWRLEYSISKIATVWFAVMHNRVPDDSGIKQSKTTGLMSINFTFD